MVFLRELQGRLTVSERTNFTESVRQPFTTKAVASTEDMEDAETRGVRVDVYVTLSGN